MISWLCPACDTEYHHACEIVQAGGKVERHGFALVFYCKCGARVEEAELWKTNPKFELIRLALED